ncbi:MAG: DNA alkylation repair protein, partial [Tannerellaceae bacterium]
MSIEKIKEIRTQLRLAMNGVASTSMREKGIAYKMNFGVSLPKLKEIALTHQKEAVLAEALWKEDVRELKILATLLYPFDAFTAERAECWVRQVGQQEIAEQYCMNLLQHVALPCSFEMAVGWIKEREEEFVQVVGFLWLSRLLATKGEGLSAACRDVLFRTARETMDNGISRIQRAAVIALKQYGRQSTQQAALALAVVEDYQQSD